MFNKILNFIDGVIGDINNLDKYTTTKNSSEKEETSIFEKQENKEQTQNDNFDLLSSVLSSSYNDSGAKVIKESINSLSDDDFDLEFETEDKDYPQPDTENKSIQENLKVVYSELAMWINPKKILC